MITKETIMEAYLFMRKENQSVPSETLEFMKDTALAELDKSKVKNLPMHGVSHSTILNGTDELTTYGEKHRKDCEKIKAALVNNGYVNTGLSDAVVLWGDYSDTYAAGWLELPDTEEEIFECVKDYIRNPYCG